jgi:hypothetical protein
MRDNHSSFLQFFLVPHIHHVKSPFEVIFLYRHQSQAGNGGYPAQSGYTGGIRAL